MKKNTIIAIFSIISLLMPESSKFKVEGMTCVGGCVFTVNNITQKIDGVKSSNVDFEKGILTVDYDPSKVDDALIVKTLSAGTSYKVKTINMKDTKSPFSWFRKFF